MFKVDVAINIYGKPYQTAVALFSLLRHSGTRIDKIYFIQERRQPNRTEAKCFGLLKNILEERIIPYVPEFYLGVVPIPQILFPLIQVRSVRHAIRYQYAWEHTDKKFLFITHNDVLYRSDIVGHFISNIGDNIGIGTIGQCWNCSASMANLCDGDKYPSFRPGHQEFQQLTKSFPPSRRIFEKPGKGKVVWPLPECRLNEWTCLINLELAGPITAPLGKAAPFGLMRQDTGTKWFLDVHAMGFLAKNIDISAYAEHDWANRTGGGGHSTLFDQNQYRSAEMIAKSVLETDYPDQWRP